MARLLQDAGEGGKITGAAAASRGKSELAVIGPRIMKAVCVKNNLDDS